MKKLGLLGSSAIGSAAFIGLTIAAAAPAYAQAADQPTQNSQQQAQPGSQPGDTPQTNQVNPQSEVETQTGQVPEAGNENAITVTGTRIRRPNLSSPVPITSVTAAELPNQGQASIGDALNQLPSLRSTFSQQNSGQFIGTAGENFLDLRGLGTTRTLVLVNGRRHVTSSVGDFIVDINTIPQDLIERIDIVTGGEAAVYGSDAVAGVVNFVLKRNFDGFRMRVQDGVSSRGDRPVQVATMTAGRNFADGRGNIAVSLEYTHAAPIYTKQRDSQTGAFSGRCQFQLVENTIGEPQAGDGIPDDEFLCGVKNAAISNGGTIGFINGQGDALRFDKSGNLVIDHPTQSFVPVGSGNQQGGTGSTLEDTGQLAVGQTRYVANLLAHFDVSNAFKPFVEATYVHQRVLQEGQPSFFQGIPGFFGAGNDFSCSNAFLNAQALGTLKSFGLCANPNDTFPLSRFNVDFGGRAEIDKRDTLRVVGGIEGDFLDTWHYEVAANYGRFESTNVETHDLKVFDQNGNPDGFLLAIDAVRNAQGQIVCAVNQVTVTRPDCVPIDVFGEGAPSQAALNFVDTTSHLYGHATELDLTAYVSGDTSKFLNLPGGPVGFSVGAEYRRETATQHADPLSAAGGTFFNAFKGFYPPAFDVKEIYGEINIPIVKDVPLIHELTISGAARYSDYNTSANTTWAWNLNGVYAPTSDLRFRANYSRSVRVPTLNDLFSPASVNFGFVGDPCDQANINSGTPTRAANCAALGVPTTLPAGSPCVDATHPVGSPFINCVARAQTIEFLSGGNPNLKAEVGKSLTIGGVLTPRFLPGFSLTVDYFDIKVNNLIATLDAQTILNECVDSPSLNNQFCPLINPRNQFGLLASPALLSSGINFAKQTARGVDFDLAYRRNFSNGGRLNLRGVMTWMIERNDYTDPTNPTIAFHQLYNLGDPEFRANLQAGYGKGPWDFTLTEQWIGRQTITSWENTHSFQGRPPQNPDATSVVWYPNVFYTDIQASVKVNSHFRFYMGVDNLFDRLPPYNTLGTASTGIGGISAYSDIGRYFYGGAQVDF
ncbi:MAG TPA: TonB-dependent receptor [Allosphingosinicella sp.]|jgi:outer membrane receptor protein involved in Fe transport